MSVKKRLYYIANNAETIQRKCIRFFSFSNENEFKNNFDKLPPLASIYFI